MRLVPYAAIALLLGGASTALAEGAAPVSMAQTPNRAGNCHRFPENRDGFILRGICLAKSGQVDTRNRATVTRSCEGLMLCIWGDCHLARNICKGIADPDCTHRGGPLGEIPFDGPGSRQGACKAVRGQCTGALQGEVETCKAVRRLWAEGSRAP